RRPALQESHPRVKRCESTWFSTGFVAPRKLKYMPTALITGAGGGIGSAIATTLAPTHTLLLAGRPSDRLDAVAERLGATTFPLDLTDGSEIEAACEIVDELDVLVHNA